MKLNERRLNEIKIQVSKVTHKNLTMTLLNIVATEHNDDVLVVVCASCIREKGYSKQHKRVINSNQITLNYL
jgi:hypothetical protein